MSMNINSSSKNIALNNNDFGSSNYGKVIKKRENNLTFNDYNTKVTEDYDLSNLTPKHVKEEKGAVELAYEKDQAKLERELNALKEKYNYAVEKYLKSNNISTATGTNLKPSHVGRDFYESFALYAGMTYEEYNQALAALERRKITIDAAYISNIFRNPSASDIFTRSEYGGDQGDVAKLVKAYIEGDSLNTVETKQAIDMVNAIKKYYPNATDMQIINIASAFTSSGCGYIAVSNALCTYLGNMENGNEIFKEKFGFDLYYIEEGEKHYNIENLALNIFLDRFEEYDIPTLTSEDLSKGTTRPYLSGEFIDFMHEHGIECNFSYFAIDVSSTDCMETYGRSSYKEVLQEYMTYFPDSYILISSEHFDLATMDGSDLNLDHSDSALSYALPEGSVMKDVGGHAMLVTGIDQSGNPMVSSWGGEYRYIAESPAKYFQEKPTEARLALEFIQFNIIGGE